MYAPLMCGYALAVVMLFFLKIPSVEPGGEAP